MGAVQKLAAQGAITLLRNPRNCGFPAAVNRALTEFPEGDASYRRIGAGVEYSAREIAATAELDRDAGDSVNAGLAVVIPSSSGHATLAMPLLSPLADFAEAGPPDAIVLGLSPDVDLALEHAFVAAARERTSGARWIVLCEAADTRTVSRLLGADDTAILPLPPDRAALRAEIATAFARRRVDPIDASRREGRTASRFEAWLGGTPIAGLARALDAAPPVTKPATKKR